MTYNQEKISGYVEDIVFRNEENGYTVYQYAIENRLPQNLLKQKVTDYVYEAVK